MAECPSCGTKVASPAKVFPVLAATEGEDGFTESRVGLYECGRCAFRFPHSFSKIKFEIIESESLRKLRGEIASANSLNQELMAKSSQLKEEIESMRRRMEILELEGRADGLLREVDALRKGRIILEEEISGPNLVGIIGVDEKVPNTSRS